MVAERVSDKARYIGLSTDDKPILKVKNGSDFWEHDTGRSFIFYNGIWYPFGSFTINSDGTIVDPTNFNQIENNVAQILGNILNEIKRINYHLQFITDEEIEIRDLEE